MVKLKLNELKQPYIMARDNNELLENASALRLPGNGKPDNPIIISNLDLFNTYKCNAILLSNTDLHVIIKNCRFITATYQGALSRASAIHLSNVSNITCIDNYFVCVGSSCGLFIHNTNNCQIVFNRFYGDAFVYALFYDKISRNLIAGNIVTSEIDTFIGGYDICKYNAICYNIIFDVASKMMWGENLDKTENRIFHNLLISDLYKHNKENI